MEASLSRLVSSSTEGLALALRYFVMRDFWFLILGSDSDFLQAKVTAVLGKSPEKAELDCSFSTVGWSNTLLANAEFFCTCIKNSSVPYQQYVLYLFFLLFL